HGEAAVMLDPDQIVFCQVAYCDKKAVWRCVDSGMRYCNDHRRPHGTEDEPHKYVRVYPKMKILPPNEVTTYQSARSDAGPPAVGLSVSKTKRGDALSTEANLPRSAETRADIPRQCEKFVEKKEKPWPKGSRVVIEVPAKERP